MSADKLKKSCGRLDLDRFFYDLRDMPYVVVRGGPESFPAYVKGADIDIFCYDKKDVGRRILATGNESVTGGMEIRVTDDRDTVHTHVDFVENGELDFRFDLYGRFPQYTKTCIKEHLLLSVIENARTVERKWKDRPYLFYQPSDIDDLLLRYIEYVEYYEQRPDKVKHLDFILKSLEDDRSRIGFLDKLHRYTDLPKCVEYVPPHAVSRHRSGSMGGLYHAKGLIAAVTRRLLPRRVIQKAHTIYGRLRG